MDATATYCAPRHWLHAGKYLLPVGVSHSTLLPARSPRHQVPVAQLATDHPESVSLHPAGPAELLPELPYLCYASGVREVRRLPAKSVEPAYIAQIRNGLSFGRHCCVIGPAGKAMRETGFQLDGNVRVEHVPVSRLRLQYWRKRWEGDVTSRPWLPPRQRVAGRVAVLNTRMSHNFFHWMIDVLPRLAPLRRVGLEADYYLVDCLSSFQRDVLARLGIESRRLIQPHCRLLLEADQLLVPSLPTPTCLRAFGPMLAAAIGADGPSTSSRRLFITRRRTGTRTLSNEPQLEALLRQRGFEIHSMEQYPLARQARLIHEAQLIVATHGAGLANLLFARPGTQVIEICPAGRFNATCYPNKSRIFGLHHQMVFAQRARHRQILRVSLDDVDAALTYAEQRPCHAAVA